MVVRVASKSKSLTFHRKKNISPMGLDDYVEKFDEFFQTVRGRSGSRIVRFSDSSLEGNTIADIAFRTANGKDDVPSSVLVGVAGLVPVVDSGISVEDAVEPQLEKIATKDEPLTVELFKLSAPFPQLPEPIEIVGKHPGHYQCPLFIACRALSTTVPTNKDKKMRSANRPKPEVVPPCATVDDDGDEDDVVVQRGHEYFVHAMEETRAYLRRKNTSSRKTRSTPGKTKLTRDTKENINKCIKARNTMQRIIWGS